jgi:hypothetical protein
MLKRGESNHALRAEKVLRSKQENELRIKDAKARLRDKFGDSDAEKKWSHVLSKMLPSLGKSSLSKSQNVTKAVRIFKGAKNARPGAATGPTSPLGSNASPSNSSPGVSPTILATSPRVSEAFITTE